LAGRHDGGEWLRDTVPANGTVIFEGDSEARVVQPTFLGPCTFVIGPKAAQRMPETTSRLKLIFEEHCDVYLQSPSGERTKVSTAMVPGQTVAHGTSPRIDYRCMSDARLKSSISGFVAQIKSSLQKYYSDDQQVSEDWWQWSIRASRADKSAGEADVMAFKDELRREDLGNQWHSDYWSEMEPRGVSMQRETISRVHETSDQHQSFEDVGTIPRTSTLWRAISKNSPLNCLTPPTTNALVSDGEMRGQTGTCPDYLQQER